MVIAAKVRARDTPTGQTEVRTGDAKLCLVWAKGALYSLYVITMVVYSLEYVFL